MTYETQNQYFRTSDMWLASVLMALGESMIRVERGEGPRAMFTFAHSVSIAPAVERYQAGELRIEPQKLFVQTKLLKYHLYN